MEQYHLSKINKGKIGESSKILEELQELMDAEHQETKVMALIECCDIYGALESYVENNFPNMSMDDIKKFSDLTKRARQ
jgi:hypothetical protein